MFTQMYQAFNKTVSQWNSLINAVISVLTHYSCLLWDCASAMVTNIFNSRFIRVTCNLPPHIFETDDCYKLNLFIVHFGRYKTDFTELTSYFK
ncbi:hypothetical protein XENTR_v10002754 [Xenopus tropicalis]|nr:hypothetical protein XENTR_v10002754 [Xenopus tropicalis]